ncbi:hypothetical protein GQ54DRAFT_299380 [Martensiomyces pterosporus]|nr:hypothetical protein GQ54DRAFT_299380 [Martensiomyces pterosporus]
MEDPTGAPKRDREGAIEDGNSSKESAAGRPASRAEHRSLLGALSSYLLPQKTPASELNLETTEELDTAAERIAEEAAKDAGWQVPWPRVRMMSQSPDLAATSASQQQQQQQQNQQQKQKQQIQQQQKNNSPMARGAWTQLTKFVAEVTEVFGQSAHGPPETASQSFSCSAGQQQHEDDDKPGDNGHSDTAMDDRRYVDEFSLDECDDQFDHHHSHDPLDVSSRAGESVSGAREFLRAQDQHSFVGGPMISYGSDSHVHSALPAPTAAPQNADAGAGQKSARLVHSKGQALAQFARHHPLLALLVGWMLMVFVDWFLTSSAIPKLVSVLTMRPWSPFSESFVLRASIMLPGLEDEDTTMFMKMKRRLLRGELWVDDVVWKIQMFVSGTLVPLTRPYAIQWLCFALLSLKALKRCSTIGYRAAAVYVLFFAISDLVLWKILGPSCSAHSGYYPGHHLAAYTSPSYECDGDACRVATRVTPPPPTDPQLAHSTEDLDDTRIRYQQLPLIPTAKLFLRKSHPQSLPHAGDGLDEFAGTSGDISESVAPPAQADSTQLCTGHMEKLGLCSLTDAPVGAGDVHNTPAAAAASDRKSSIDTRSSSGLEETAPTLMSPQNIRSPFANAVEEALVRNRAMVERRNERMRSLHEWKKTMADAEISAVDGSSSRLLPAAATLSVYLYLVWQVRGLSLSTLRLCAILFLLDMAIRNSQGAVGPCKGSCAGNTSRRMWDMGHTLIDSLGSMWGCGLGSAGCWTLLHRAVLALLACVRDVAGGGIRFCLCLMAGAHSNGSSGPALFQACTGWSCLLPIHVISMFSLLVLRELGYVVHNMRVWYSTVVKERRRGPYMVTARARNTEGISLSKELAPAEHPDGSAASSGSAAHQSGGSKAAYARRVCFLCLSGYCERCLLSMEIWPTGQSDQSGDGGSSGGGAGGEGSLDSGFAGASSGGTGGSGGGGGSSHRREGSSGGSSSNPELLAPQPRRRVRGAGKHGKPASIVIPSAADALTADANNGLPPLRDSLLSLGLLSPSLNSPAAPAFASGGKRGKTMDAWIVSSVAHCPCRAVHGVGPSAFVSRAARMQTAARQAKDHDMDQFVPPVGTLLPLAQYVRELKSLGLVRPVDPASVVFSDEDPTASVLPLIFGRFTMPENPRAVAAANALLASSATSYAQLTQPTGHTPGNLPFLGTQPGVGKSGEIQSSRILVKPTPLSVARAPGAGTFRVCAEGIQPQEGMVKVRVTMTPVLAHLLLAHPKTSPTAAVCVSASLVSAVASRSKAVVRMQAPQPHSGGSGGVSRHAQTPSVSSSISSELGDGGDSRVLDVDPLFDYARVQLSRSDVVVRVDGARWQDVELGSALNQPMTIRGLSPNHSYSICVAICGMRSEDLYVFLPSAESAIAKEKLAKQLEVAAFVARLDDTNRAKQSVQQRLKRAKKEVPKQIQHWQHELESVRKSVVKQTQAEARFRRRQVQLEENIGALNSDVEDLRGELERALADEDAVVGCEDDLDEAGATVASATDTDATFVGGSGSTFVADSGTPGPLAGKTGFSVLSALNDATTSSSPAANTRPNSQRSTPAESPLHSRHGSTSTATNASHHGGAGDEARKPQVSSQLAQALLELRRVEALAKRAQDEHEEAIQELKAERARLMASLSQANNRLEPAERNIEPVKRYLKEISKKVIVGKSTEAKLLKKLDDAERRLGSTYRRDGGHAANSSAGSGGGGGGGFGSSDDDSSAQRELLLERLEAIREAIRDEQARIQTLGAYSALTF